MLAAQVEGPSQVAEILQPLFDHLFFGRIQTARIDLRDLLQHERQQGFEIVKAASKLPFHFQAKILRQAQCSKLNHHASAPGYLKEREVIQLYGEVGQGKVFLELPGLQAARRLAAPIETASQCREQARWRKLLLFSSRKEISVDRYMTDAGELKLNIGCGTSGVKGWVNIDNSPSILLSRFPFGRRIFRTPDWPRDVRRADVRKRIPFPDSSVSCIYSSHAFECLTYQESVAVARECFRVLKPGGIVRIVVPDLGIFVRDYLADAANAMASHRFISRLLLTPSFSDMVHPGAHHKQMFDARSLAHMLQEAGFTTPEVSSFGSSRIAEIAEIELGSRRSESLYVEAIR